jgi:hypothetical protein
MKQLTAFLRKSDAELDATFAAANRDGGGTRPEPE